MDESSPALWAVEKSGGKWQMARHLAVIDRALVRAAHEPDQRIIVQMPPRHGKSCLVSQWFPAWYRRRFPRRNMMMWSATARLAQRFSTYVRELCDIPIDESTHSWENWKVYGTEPNEGEFYAAGIGGGSTMGAGCHIGIIDDYHRNVEDALSETIRAKQQQWFLSSCETRLEPGASLVILATRWHVDDLIGFVLKNAEETGEHWDVIRMKAIGDDGAALWPERWPLKRLEAKRAEYHKSGYPWMWDALYQQEPPAVIDSEWDPAYFHRGIMFDQWPENISFKVVVLDPSVGHNEKTDPSAIVVAGVDGLGHVWVDADIRRRDAQVQVNDVMWWFVHERACALGIEINGFQGVLRGMFERKCQELCFYPLIHGISSHIEKRMKIRANVTPLLSRGMLHFKKGSPGISLLLEQLRGFPSHKHDDGPDALAMAIGLIHDISRSGIPSDVLDVQYEIASA